MKRRVFIFTALVCAMVIGGFVTLPLWLPRVIFWHTLNSFPGKPWLVEALKKGIVLITFDEKTKVALGGHTKEIFRKNFAELLPILQASNPWAIIADVGFEGETDADAKLQDVLDSRYMWNVVWGRSFDTDSRFARKAWGIQEPLTLGHIRLAYITLYGKQLTYMEPCIVTQEGKATPPLALLAYQTILGRLTTYTDQDCSYWENGEARLKTEIKIDSDRAWASSDYKKIPMLTGKDGRKWIPIRYSGKDGFFKRISFSDVLRRPFLDVRSELWNKIIFVGVTLPEAKDRHITEVGEMDGLEIHAHILTTLMRVLVDKE